VRGVDAYLAIGTFLDQGLAQQVGFDLDALERAIGRTLAAGERARLLGSSARRTAGPSSVPACRIRSSWRPSASCRLRSAHAWSRWRRRSRSGRRDAPSLRRDREVVARRGVVPRRVRRPAAFRIALRTGAARRRRAAHGHVIAAAPEDSAEADRLVELLRACGVTGRFDLLAVDDEAALAGVLEEDPDGASTYVLLLSRAFTARMRSLPALDALLGRLLLGRRRVLAAGLPDDREPPRDLAAS